MLTKMSKPVHTTLLQYIDNFAIGEIYFGEPEIYDPVFNQINPVKTLISRQMGVSVYANKVQ